MPQGDTRPRPADPVISTVWSHDGITIGTMRGSFPPEPWTAPLLTTTWGVTLAYRGAYRRRADGLEQIVDAGTGFLRRPGQEVSTSTFTSIPEDLTVVTLDAPFLHQLPDLSPSAGPVTVEPPVALGHRLLRRRLQEPPDNLGVQCAVVELVQRCLRPVRPDQPGTVRASTAAARRRLVTDTVQILNVILGDDLGLIDIARLVGTSPAHLSRVFREVTGVTMSRYRTWLRVHSQRRSGRTRRFD